MPVYPIKSWRGGISDENDKGIAGSFKFGKNIDIHKKDDTLSCTQAMKKESGTVVTDLILVMLNATDGNSYHFGDSGKIYKRTSAGVWTNVYTDANGRISGAWEWKDSAGSDYIYWATESNLSRKPFPGLSDWSDVQHNIQTLETADWHTMKEAGGVLAICNGNYLATVDYAGLFTGQAMNLRPGNIAKTLEERDDYIIIGSYRNDDSEKGHIWSWKTSVDNYIQKKMIPAKGVNGMITTEVMVLQAGTNGELYFSDLVNKVPLLGVENVSKVNPGGVTNKRGLAMFGFFDSPYVSGESEPGIYSYGRRRKNRPYALVLEHTLSPSEVAEIGAVEMIGDDLLASWKDTSGAYGVDVIDNANKADGIFESLEFDGKTPFLAKEFKEVKVKMSALPTDCSLKLKYKLNKESTWQTAYLGNKSDTFSQAGETEAIFYIQKGWAEVIEVRAELYSSGNDCPEITSINVYFSDDKEGNLL